MAWGVRMRKVEKKHIGIVLRKHQFALDRFWVFDRHDGKIQCVIREFEPAVGALICFVISRQTATVTLIREVKILDVPLEIARQDILFLHHTLELCYYFLSIRSAAAKTFEIVMLLYLFSGWPMSPLRKKIFLFKLLVSFGCYSSHTPLSINTFYRLSSESIDNIVQAPLHLEVERNVDKWLCSCIGEHPYARDFKTVQFLTKIRVP